LAGIRIYLAVAYFFGAPCMEDAKSELMVQWSSEHRRSNV